MTTQEAIEKADRIRLILRFRVESSGTLDYDSNVGMCDALESLIRAAEENEGRKLAEKWAHEIGSCHKCPIHDDCANQYKMKPFCDYPDMHLDLWVESAKKEGTP